MIVLFPVSLCSSSSLTVSESDIMVFSCLVGPGLVICGVVRGVVLGGALLFVILEVSLFGLETVMESFMLIEGRGLFGFSARPAVAGAEMELLGRGFWVALGEEVDLIRLADGFVMDGRWVVDGAGWSYVWGVRKIFQRFSPPVLGVR